MEPTTNQSSPAIPIAIIFGFAMIALAIFFTSTREPNPVAIQPINTEDTENTISNGKPRAVNETDYIYGNPNAPILVIEYSDYECPFCKQYHATMNQIMDEFGVTGKVAWVYRQFPLTQLHPNAAKISEAALCVGDIGGNEAFWRFSNQVFEERDANSPTNVTQLPQYATDSGIEQASYIECMNSGRMRDTVLESAEEAFQIGARGTPYSIVTIGNQQAVVNGAQPYSVVRGIIQNLIDQIDGTFETNKLTPTETP